MTGLLIGAGVIHLLVWCSITGLLMDKVRCPPGYIAGPLIMAWLILLAAPIMFIVVRVFFFLH